VIGNFNFTPVRKTFDAEEVDCDVIFCFSFEKKFKIKKRKLFFKVRKDTLTEVSPVGIFRMDVAGLTT
jgi:hypothetical protein